MLFLCIVIGVFKHHVTLAVYKEYTRMHRGNQSFSLASEIDFMNSFTFTMCWFGTRFCDPFHASFSSGKIPKTKTLALLLSTCRGSLSIFSIGQDSFQNLLHIPLSLSTQHPSISPHMPPLRIAFEME